MSSLVPSSSQELLHKNDLGDLLRDRVAVALKSMAPGTQRAYSDALQRFARWYSAWLPVAPQVVRSNIANASVDQTWWSVIVQLLRSSPLVANTVVESFRSSPSAGKAPATIALRLAAVRWPFILAYEAGIVAWQLRVRSPKVIAYRDTRGPGLDNVRKLFAVADRGRAITGARDAVLLSLLFVEGLRRNEVHELNVEHFDGERGLLLVRDKGKLDRTPIKLPPGVTERIVTYLRLRGPLVLDAPLVASHDRRCRSDRLTGNGIWRRVRWLAKKAEIHARTTPHGLRHTAITTGLDETNGNTRAVRSFSRHAKDETVGIYDDERQNVGGRIAELLAHAVQLGPSPHGR
jgi:integrase